MGCFVFNRRWLERSHKREQLKRLLAAYDVAVDRINKGGKAVCDSVFLLDYGLTKTEIDTLRLPKFERSHRPATKDVETALDFLRRRRRIPKSYHPDSLVVTANMK